MPYIYAADIYCDQCGEDIKSQLKPSEDSNEYPQYILTSGESDTPQHCGFHSDCINAFEVEGFGLVGEMIDGTLTPEGIDYVMDTEGQLGGYWRAFYGLD